ncbi:MAG: PAS domain S-box protein [Burkholderiaceae bacterium]|nr:PAS domain S-box protein [Burkholderiaceae bacterium]
MNPSGWLRSRRPLSVAVGVFGVGIALALAAAYWQTQKNQLEANARFAELSKSVIEQINERLQVYEHGVRSARGLILGLGPDKIDRRTFRTYWESRDFDQEFPGARGIGFIRRVPVEKEAAFLAAARQDGAPDFAIPQLAPYDRERYVIQYIEPVARNRQAVGLDIASENNRRTAALTSMRNNATVLTGPITIVQAMARPQQAFLLLMPVYRTGAAHATVAEREAATIGWSYATLVMDEILSSLHLVDTHFTFTLSDVSGAEPQLFFASARSDVPAADGVAQRVTAPMFARQWAADFRATQAFRAGLNLTSPRTVGALCAGISALLALVAYAFVRAREREQYIRAEQVRRAAIVAASNDAIIGATLDGIVTDWNHGAEKMFGYAEMQAIGQSLPSLIVPKGFEGEDAGIREAIRSGRVIAPLDTTRQRSDGSCVDVSIAVSPIMAQDGRCIGLSKSMRDISVARRAERAVRELNASLEAQVLERTALLESARHTLETILDALPAPVAYWSRDLINQMANRAHKAWYGVEVDRVPGMHIRELIGDASYERSRSYLQAALNGQDQTFLETSVPLGAGGDPKHAMVNYMPDVVDGVVRGIFSMLHDVTELTRTTARFALAADAARLGVWEWDLANQSLNWDDRMFQLYGRTRAEGMLPYTLWSTSLHADDRARCEREIAEAIERGADFNTEFRIVHPDGVVRHIRAAARSEHDAEGKPIRMIGVNLDITKRKESELQLLATSSLLQTVLESASEVAIIATAPDLTIRVFNVGAVRMLGYASEEVVGKATPALIHDPGEISTRAAALSTELGYLVEGTEVFTEPSALREAREWTYIRKDGSRLPVSLIVTEMRGEDGQLFGYLGVAQDVTRQKQTEQSLREAVHKAKKANQAKSMFLANMSHEIRTPMNAVMGLTYMLDQTALNVEQASLLAKVQIASKSLLAVINDVLDLSKIEAGELKVESAPFDPRQVLDDLRSVFSVQAQSKGIACNMETETDLPEAVQGDAARLTQVLSNLLNNAIKFTERGSVQLRVRGLGATGDGVKLRFEVQDSGIGVAPEMQRRLFEPFAQADASTTRRFGGSGLGLSIVKHLVTLMGGEVSMVSIPGVGSEFSVEMPFGLASRAALHATQVGSGAKGAIDLNGVRVLVVDDSDINQEVARHILQRHKAHVWLAGNGLEAIEQLRAAPAGFDVVLMDVQMPVLDGHEATRRIRQELGLKNLPIIALTAGALTSQHQIAAESGMDDFISKPFDAMGLVLCIRRHVRHQGVTLADAGPTSPPTAMANTSRWPHIEGIDTKDAAQRLGGDLSLFQTMLKWLLDEFQDIDQPEPGDTTALQALARRMHKLRESAGLLGAQAIYKLASETETVCSNGDHANAMLLVKALQAQLNDLHLHAGPALVQLQADEADAGDPIVGELDPQQLITLEAMLNEQNLGALEQFKELAPHLRQKLGRDAFADIRDQVNNLQFAEAADSLHGALNTATS